MRPLPFFALFLGLWLGTGCVDEPPAATTQGGERARLCQDGGATFDGASNTCVCPPGRGWDGLRCSTTAALPPPSSPPPPAAVQSPPPAANLTGEAPRTGGSTDDHGETVSQLAPTSAASPADQASGGKPPAATPSLMTRLAGVCRRAGGQWVAGEGYCHCPSQQVLVGNRCRALKGRITDDTCQRALRKGRWIDGDCLCRPGLVFAPARGGCVEKVDARWTYFRRTCESSLNLGKWDAARQRCQCPTGRIWRDERCLEQHRLTSRQVCESAFNRGRWDAARRRCDCPSGRLWLDQECQSTTAVSPEAACQGEASGGRWDAATGSCACPAPTQWRAAEKSCR